MDEYARLFYDHGGYDDRPPMFPVTMSFSEAGKKTKMEMTISLASEQAAKETKEFIKKAVVVATWDRLAEDLSATDRFVINRCFDAPIDVMFDMWTNPNHVAAWLPPAGLTMEFLRADIEPGGSDELPTDSEAAPHRVYAGVLRQGREPIATFNGQGRLINSKRF